MRIKNLCLRPPDLPNSKGFTFVEILLTLVVLSFGLVFIMRSFTNVFVADKTAEEIKAASCLLEEELEKLKEKSREEGGVSPGSSAYEILYNDRAYGCLLTIVPSGVDETLEKVNMRLTWHVGTKEKYLCADTYFTKKSE
jgi:prepilin-type N-terminal cleavage/methylation domain-containing protein